MFKIYESMMYELLAGKIFYREFFVDFRILVDTFFLGKGYWWTGCVFKSLNGLFTIHNSNIDAKTLHTQARQRMSLKNSVCDLFAAMSANCNSQETNNLDPYEFSIISLDHVGVSYPISRPGPSHCRGSCFGLFGSENLDESCRLTPPMAGRQVGDVGSDVRRDAKFMETNKDSRFMMFYDCFMSILDDDILGPRV